MHVNINIEKTAEIAAGCALISATLLGAAAVGAYDRSEGLQSTAYEAGAHGHEQYAGDLMSQSIDADSRADSLAAGGLLAGAGAVALLGVSVGFYNRTVRISVPSLRQSGASRRPATAS